MKKIFTFTLVIVAILLGHAIWILSLVNFVWLLVKDVTLFNWMWVVSVIIGFVISVALTFYFVTKN